MENHWNKSSRPGCNVIVELFLIGYGDISDDKGIESDNNNASDDEENESWRQQLNCTIIDSNQES